MSLTTLLSGEPWAQIVWVLKYRISPTFKVTLVSGTAYLTFFFKYDLWFKVSSTKPITSSTSS